MFFQCCKCSQQAKIVFLINYWFSHTAEEYAASALLLHRPHDIPLLVKNLRSQKRTADWPCHSNVIERAELFHAPIHFIPLYRSAQDYGLNHTISLSLIWQNIHIYLYCQFIHFVQISIQVSSAILESSWCLFRVPSCHSVFSKIKKVSKIIP